MKKNSVIFVAGHRGLVGSALMRELKYQGYENLVTRTHSQLDLLNSVHVRIFFEHNPIQFVFVAAGKVGGIHANETFPAEFIYENAMIACNLIHNAAFYGVEKLVYLGSSCIYPKMAEQPIREESLLTGPLEATNEPYALAKILGVKYCEAVRKQYENPFVSVMPCNLYGPNDNYDPQASHVIPGMMYRFHKAKIDKAPEVKLWGTGAARREFLHVNDAARGIIDVMHSYDEPGPINLGSGVDITIRELSQIMKEIVGYKGEVTFVGIGPDGTPRKVLDVTKIRALGWKPRWNDLRLGLKTVYQEEFLKKRA